MTIHRFFKSMITFSIFSLLGAFPLKAQISFEDVTVEAGLLEALKGIKGHSASWGDVTGNGYPDLFVGTFSDRPDSIYATRGHHAKPEPDKLFLNRGDGTFVEVTESPVRQYGRCSGSAFADLDNDGDLDLVVSHNARLPDSPKAQHKTGNFLFENLGGGEFRDVTDRAGLNFGLPFTGRNTFVFDYNGDGLLDLFMQEDWVLDSISGGNSRLMENQGDLVFKDVTAEAGFPHGFRNGLYGLGGFVGDMNGDLWPDVFFSHSCRMFINNRDGTFREKIYDMVPPNYRLPGTRADGYWTCGADLGDLDNDGDMDLVMGQHFLQLDTVKQRIFVFLNEGNDAEGNPLLRDITWESRLEQPTRKVPNIQLQDLDNDGRLDILATAGNGLAYRNKGSLNGIPRFDIPTASGIEEGNGYWACGPLGDFNRDGRLDFFGPEWLTSAHSPLLKNTSPEAGHYLAVKLELEDGRNRNGLDARVDIYTQGNLGNEKQRIASRIITVSNGYASGYESIAYFGLPAHETVDIRVSMPCGGQVYTAAGIRRNQLFILRK
jgi:hypothetical protein